MCGVYVYMCMCGVYVWCVCVVCMSVPALGVVWVFVEGSIPLVYCIVEEVMVEVEVGDGLVKPVCTLITILTPAKHSPPDHALLTAPTKVPSLKPATKKSHVT